MNKIIQSKPWQLFIILIFPWMFLISIPEKSRYSVLWDVAVLLVIFIPISWVIILDIKLYKQVNRKFQNIINAKLYKINLFVLLLFSIQIILIFSSVQPYLNSSLFVWINIISSIISIYGVFAIFYFYYIFSKCLIILEGKLGEGGKK